MKLFGYELRLPSFKAPRINNSDAMTSVDSGRGGWFGIWGSIRESFSGAFQMGVTIDAPAELLAFSAVYACVTKIASDIGKLRPILVAEDEDGICVEVVATNPYWTALKKPNKYQNRIKFFEQWQVSKLLYGNTYVLKQRDRRGIVVGLYILDAQRVVPLVATNGDVYYQLAADHLSGIDLQITVPANEIIHDMMVSLFHPLVGVSPIYACGLSATQGRKIQKNSSKFFENMSRPSGMLSAPGTISDEVAKRLKAHWEENFSGSNIGRVAVLGDNLKYEAMTIPANEAQLIEQLKWTVDDVARCFHMPVYKLGGAITQGSSIEALNNEYYSDCLQTLIESTELCLDEGLALKAGYYTMFDLDGLLRMDTGARYKALGEAIKAAWMSPNEARKKENMRPVAGGDSPMIQQQNFSLEAIGKRDALPNPFVIDRATTNPTPSDAGPAGTADPAAKAFIALIKALDSMEITNA